MHSAERLQHIYQGEGWGLQPLLFPANVQEPQKLGILAQTRATDLFSLVFPGGRWMKSLGLSLLWQRETLLVSVLLT